MSRDFELFANARLFRDGNIIKPNGRLAFPFVLLTVHVNIFCSNVTLRKII